MGRRELCYGKVPILVIICYRFGDWRDIHGYGIIERLWLISTTTSTSNSSNPFLFYERVLPFLRIIRVELCWTVAMYSVSRLLVAC